MTFTRKSWVFQNRNFFFIRCIGLSTVSFVWFSNSFKGLVCVLLIFGGPPDDINKLKNFLNTWMSILMCNHGSTLQFGR